MTLDAKPSNQVKELKQTKNSLYDTTHIMSLIDCLANNPWIQYYSIGSVIS